MNVTVKEGTAVVTDVKEFHTVVEENVRETSQGEPYHRVGYLTAEVTEVTSAYTNAKRYSLGADLEGNIHKADGKPAYVVAEAATAIAEFVQNNE